MKILESEKYQCKNRIISVCPISWIVNRQLFQSDLMEWTIVELNHHRAIQPDG